MDDKIERVVQAAILAPSGDNCQPWQFTWNGRELVIAQEDSRARHALNYLNHASCVALGGVLESIQIAGAQEGLSVTYSLSDNLKKNPGAKVQFQMASPQTPDDLYPALTLRATDRRLYQKGSLQEPLFERVKRDVFARPACGFYWHDRFPAPLVDYIAQTSCYPFEWRSAHHDLFRWIRFSDKAALRTRDGMSWRNLGGNFLEVLAVRFCKSFIIQRAANPILFKKLMRAQSKRSVLSSAALGLLTVKSEAPEHLVEAGKIGFRIWCRLNLNGYAFQPLLSATLPSYDKRAGAPPLNPFYRDLFEKGHSILQSVFHFSDNEIPLLLFRTGKMEPLPIKSRALHRELSKVYKRISE